MLSPYWCKQLCSDADGYLSRVCDKMSRVCDKMSRVCDKMHNFIFFCTIFLPKGWPLENVCGEKWQKTKQKQTNTHKKISTSHLQKQSNKKQNRHNRHKMQRTSHITSFITVAESVIHFYIFKIIIGPAKRCDAHLLPMLCKLLGRPSRPASNAHE